MLPVLGKKAVLEWCMCERRFDWIIVCMSEMWKNSIIKSALYTYSSYTQLASSAVFLSKDILNIIAGSGKMIKRCPFRKIKRLGRTAIQYYVMGSEDVTEF
ncbi:hypothetical protein TNCV_4276681 [Trichonephila clavipes]|nr:hypothetical protein TNCV_4276681 [Trichonephila clavipes]